MQNSPTPGSAAWNENSMPNVSSTAAALTPADSARNKIIEEYLPFVTMVLTKLQRGLPQHLHPDDLYSAGVDGLVAAAKRFDPSQVGSFPSYVRLRIRGAILDELRRLDPCTRRSRCWIKKYQHAVSEAEQLLGRQPTDRELSERLNMTPAELGRRRGLAEPIKIISLDSEPRSDADSSLHLHDCIADHGQPDIREIMEKEEMTQLLTSRMVELPDIPRKLLALYYFEGLRFGEIGEVFGLSEARICQIHKETLLKLQTTVKSSQTPCTRMSDFVRKTPGEAVIKLRRVEHPATKTRSNRKGAR